MDDYIVDVCVWMKHAAKWFVGLLDKHEGAWMVLLTAALVWFAYKSAKIALRNLEMIMRNDDKRSLPYVTLEVVNDMPFYGVRMINFGTTAAHNVIVKSEPKIEMVFQRYRKPIGFLQGPVGYIAPSAHFETDIGTFRDIENANPAKVYKGTISFENDDGKRFEHEFMLDFTPYTDVVHKDEKTIHHVAQQLEEIKRELINIGNGCHKPHILTEGYEEYNERVEMIRDENKNAKETSNVHVKKGEEQNEH